MAVISHFTEVDPYKDSNQAVAKCLEGWVKFRGQQQFPRWSEFDWFEFPTAVIPYFVVCDVKNNPLDFQYRFWGTAHAHIFHQDYTGKSVRDVSPQVVGDGLFDQYAKMLELKVPTLFLFEVLGGVGQDRPITEASLRLPFSEDGKNIDKIFSFSDNRRNTTEFSKFFENNMTP